MIALPGTTLLDAVERDALRMLADLARLPETDDDVPAAVRLELVEGEGEGSGEALSSFAARHWGIEVLDGVVRMPRASLARLWAVAARAAEQSSAARDRHGRVPAAINALVSERLERTPVVSQAGAALQRAVTTAAGRRPLRFVAPWPEGRRWAAAFTHDLDIVSLWPAFTALRIAELLAHRHAIAAARVLGAAAMASGQPVVEAGVRQLLERANAAGVPATWFVLAGTPNGQSVRAGDLTYRVESPRARRILAAVAEHGHEIGLHGSFETLDHPARFAAQRARLAAVSGRASAGVRQHFLRALPGRTEVAMESAGFAYDSTCGFADRNGFRSGIADVHPVWDAGSRRALRIVEAPFCWMDRALSKYQRIEDPRAWVDDALELARACRDVEGLWAGVWHPNLTPPLGYPGAPEAYARLLDGILHHTPWTATLEAIVRWRAARRSVRIRRLLPDGSVEAYAASAGGAELRLEDARGTPLERVGIGSPP